MPASVWKGSIVLSFVSIPVKLVAAARSQRTYLHQLHTVCHSRLRQPLFCPTCERFVKRDEVIKGYELDEGQYVLVEGEELRKLAAKSSRILEVLAFTKLSQIDPIFFDASYFCIPDDTGKKPYQLLVKSLEDTQSIGLGRLTMHQRDYTVFLRAYQHGLVLHTMYFANEIRRVPEFGALEAVHLKPQEVKLTEQLIATMMQPFKPTQYHDEFQDRLRQLVEAKPRGQTVEVGEAANRAPVIDMMQALKKSLASRSASDAGAKKLPAKHLKVATRVKKAS
jgi:DNA end-binding protein Ku